MNYFHVGKTYAKRNAEVFFTFFGVFCTLRLAMVTGWQ